MKPELKIVLTLIFMAFTALSFHTLNAEVVETDQNFGDQVALENNQFNVR